MEVYTSLLVFSAEKTSHLLVDSNCNVPAWIIKDEPSESLDVVRRGLYSISGIDPAFYPYIDQAGTFERFDNEKEIFIVYAMYFPSKFDLPNTSYKWLKINELSPDNKYYSIIRYIYGIKKNNV